MLGDEAVEGLDVLQGPAHQAGVGDAVAVVGEHADLRGRVGHRADLGEALAGEADRDRADGLDVGVPGGAAERGDLLDDPGGVGDGVGVGHGAHGRVAALGGGAGAGADGLGVLAAGLAQVGVEVDQAGQEHQAVGVDDLGSGGAGGADLGDAALADEDVRSAAAEEVGAFDEYGSRHRTSPFVSSR